MVLSLDVHTTTWMQKVEQRMEQLPSEITNFAVILLVIRRFFALLGVLRGGIIFIFSKRGLGIICDS